MAIIYRKTAKGHTEIETRALRLAPRFRSALILVDGRRSDAELLRMILQQPAETLQALFEQGFIDVIAINAPAGPPHSTGLAPPVAQPPAAASATPAPTPLSRPAAPAMPARSFEALRAALVRSFTDSVGPMSDALAIKMERARGADELRVLAETAQRIIANARGGQAANDFRTNFIAPLGG